MTSARSSPLRTGLAWGVHAFTASGAVVAVLALLVWWNGRDRGPSMTRPREAEGPA